MSGWPFNSSRAPGASVSVPVVVSGADSVMRPANLEVGEHAGGGAAVAGQHGLARADDRVAGVGVVGHRQREAVRVERRAGLEEQIADGDVCAVSLGTTVVAAEK